MATDMRQFYQVFFEECVEHLATMELLLMELDPSAPGNEELNAIFRAAHSIKGGAGTFGFKDMTVVTHILESLLDRLRNHELVLTREMVDLFLEAGDAIGMQLAGHRDGAAVDQSVIEQICKKLETITLSVVPTKSASTVPAAEQPLPSRANEPISYEIEFAPHDDTFRRGIRLESLFKELAELGELVAAVDLGGAPAFTELDPEICHCRWHLRLQSAAGEAKIRDIFEFVAGDDELQIRIGTLDPGYGLFTGAPGATFQAAEQTSAAVSTDTLVGRRTYDKNELAPGAFGRRGLDTQDASIRVGVAKVDKLINQVGELVITQAMLTQLAGELDPILFARLHSGLTQLERNTRDLQENVMSMRMVPISFVFSRFPRVVRDTAALLGKQVELKTSGETTELDKGLIEKIADPLTHLVRNSLDHGIESPDVRIAAGKEPFGTITLSAAQQEGKIVIEVADDGAGLNREKILAKARGNGVPVIDSMADDEVWQLIFAPGFSTAEVVTDVSGRGVGMDVVLRNVKDLGGRVVIKSEPGKGSRITIRLPLTLAVLDGLSVQVGKETFVIPLNSIVESLQPQAQDLSTVHGQGQVVHIRGEYLPLLPLHELFHIEGAVTRPEQGILTIVETEGEKVALLIDALLGQQQVVIKSLEANYRKVEGSAGATILGDGRVALILDAGSLISMGRRCQGSPTQA
jgi:two-component system chemotaxis sensor kinase CheA